MKHLLKFNESNRYLTLQECINQINDHISDLEDASEVGVFQSPWGNMPTGLHHPEYGNFDECGLIDFLIKLVSLGKGVIYVKISWDNHQLTDTLKDELFTCIRSICDLIHREDLRLEGLWTKRRDIKRKIIFDKIDFEELLSGIGQNTITDIRIAFRSSDLMSESQKDATSDNYKEYILSEIGSIFDSELDYYEWDTFFESKIPGHEVMLWYGIRGVSEYMQGNLSYEELYIDGRSLSQDVIDEFSHLISFMKSEDYTPKITLVRDNFMESDDLILSGIEQLEKLALNDETLIYFEFSKNN